MRSHEDVENAGHNQLLTELVQPTARYPPERDAVVVVVCLVGRVEAISDIGATACARRSPGEAADATTSKLPVVFVSVCSTDPHVVRLSRSYDGWVGNR